MKLVVVGYEVSIPWFFKKAIDSENYLSNETTSCNNGLKVTVWR